MTELKRIDFSQPFFISNGTTYYIESGMSINRFRHYQILEKEAAFSTTFASMFAELRTIYDLMNSIQFVKASVKLDNLMSGVGKLREKEPTLLKMAALFINTKDEDRTTITEELISKKIEDWATDCDIRDFFQFALNTIQGFTSVYEAVTRDISQKIG